MLDITTVPLSPPPTHLYTIQPAESQKEADDSDTRPRLSYESLLNASLFWMTTSRVATRAPEV
jgi:hypothetical protein